MKVITDILKGEGEQEGKEMGIKKILPQFEALQCRLRE